jgi:AraC family transcriptional regulator
MTYTTIEVSEIEPQDTLSVTVHATPSTVGASFQQAMGVLSQYVQSLGVAAGAPGPFARYHTWGDDVEMEVGAVVQDDAPGNETVKRGTLPGGKVARTIHQGPYSGLQQAYSALESWMKDNGVQPAGPPWEVYLTDPQETPDPADYRTEVIWPIS